MAEELGVVAGVVPLVDLEELGVEGVFHVVDRVQHLEVDPHLDVHLMERRYHGVECRYVGEDLRELSGKGTMPK